MKKRLFGLKARDKRNLSRYKEDVIDLDDEDIDDYEDEDYPEDYYEDEDYPEDEVDDLYEDEEDYPERDYADDVRRDQYEDEVDDHYEDEIDERYEEDDYPEDEEDYPEDEMDDRYDEEDYPEDEMDDHYDEDDYPEDNYEEYPEDEDDSEYYPEDSGYDDRRGRNRRDRHSKRDDRKRRDRGASVPAKILSFIANTSATERIAAIFAIVILAGGIATASFYAKAIGNRQQLDAFAEVGANFGEETIIGQSGLLAVADAEKAKAVAAELVSEDAMEEEEEEIVPDDAENVTIKMTLTSIKSDMKVKFINSQTGKLVANLPLEIDVETPDGSKVTYNDHDQDGIIYKKDITAGVYKITPKTLPSGYENYKLEIKTQSLTVKDQVEMKAVDVSNEVKKESQVNAAKEDTAVKTEVESQLKDTVEWVESTKVAVGENSDGKATYEEISKDTIPNPASSSMVGLRPWMFMFMANGSAEASIGDEEVPADPEPGSGASSGASEHKKLVINDGNISLKVGQTKTLSISGTDGEISLSSDLDSVVSTSGTTIKAESTGTAKITASADNCESATITVTVVDADVEPEPEPTKGEISVNTSNISVKVGETYKIEASASSHITYTSNDTSIATVDGNVVKGIKEGSTSITLSAEGCNDATVHVVVTPENKKIAVNKSSVSIRVGESDTITVSEPASGAKFISSNPGVAVVDENSGLVKGIKAGTATITITASGYSDAVVSVTVSEADAKTMTVSPASVTVKVSEEVQLKVEGPKAVSYSVDKQEVATVSKDGKIKGVSVGNAIVTIKADGYKDQPVSVTVVAKEGNKVPMKISKITLVEGQSVKIASSESKLAIKLSSSNTNVVAVSDTTITGKSAGDATITVSATGYADNTVAVNVISKSKTLKDKNGNVVYVKNDDGSYREATYEDYYKGSKFYLKKAATTYKYTGWQTIDGKTYFFDKNGNFVTGEQVIQGAKYSFGADGVLVNNAGGRGIDVSKWNGNIDWAAVKNSGINFVIIRCGYRGSSAGALIEDPTFKRNIQGAQKAGIRVGVYFFTQAVNEVEAVEEASMVINLIKGYNISYPVYLDVEASHGRGDGISAAQRTANIKAFCGTIQNAGYKAGVYANKTWFTSYINTSQITNYKIWLAQYAEAVTYSASRYDMWQYTSKGRVTGINGNVDLNICY
ncbi:GH25 family lysozyme [Butyrivibrio proteoclasticus]|uniref:GH25 family lysozyme n=1 Tax=Butyrivibrio proteoclasticus TaxID=43305 RepID=UPI000687873F|nr:GH25 family lysozyme [Butyrivibrio proteoclasticus]